MCYFWKLARRISGSGKRKGRRNVLESCPRQKFPRNQTASRIFPGENFRSAHGPAKVLFHRKEKRLSRIFTVDFERTRRRTPSNRRFLRGPISWGARPLSQSLPFIEATYLSIHAYRSREWLWQSIRRFPLFSSTTRRDGSRHASLVNALADLSSRLIIEQWGPPPPPPPPPLWRAFFRGYSRRE